MNGSAVDIPIDVVSSSSHVVEYTFQIGERSVIETPDSMKSFQKRLAESKPSSNTRNMQPPQQYKQTLSPSRPVTQEITYKDAAGRPDQNINRQLNGITQMLKKILTQQRVMSDRIIAMEKVNTENATAIKNIIQGAKPKVSKNIPRISFKSIADFLKFENVDDATYDELVAHFIFLGRRNPSDCVAEYFRFVFPKDENVSTYLTLNGRSDIGGCKLRGSRFAQACYDAMIDNKYFATPTNAEFNAALEKALKSLKTRKWRVMQKRRQDECLQEDHARPKRRQRVYPRPAEVLIAKTATDCVEMEDNTRSQEVDDIEREGRSPEVEVIEDDGMHETEMFFEIERDDVEG